MCVVRVRREVKDLGQHLAQGPWTLSHGDAALDEEAADLVDDSRALADKA